MYKASTVERIIHYFESLLRQVLLAAQVAIAIVLLVGAGLMARSLASLQNVDPGFRSQGLLGVTLSLSDILFREEEEYMGAYRTLLERYRELPGVEGAASIRYLPMRGSGEQADYTVVGQPPPPQGQVQANMRLLRQSPQPGSKNIST